MTVIRKFYLGGDFSPRGEEVVIQKTTEYIGPFDSYVLAQVWLDLHGYRIENGYWHKQGSPPRSDLAEILTLTPPFEPINYCI